MGLISTRRVSVCGIDPGKMTGFFATTLYVNSDQPVRYSSPVARHLERDQVRAAVELQLDVEPTTAIGTERYVITQKTVKSTRQPDALEVTGVVQDVCRAHDVTCALQMKSDAIRAASNAFLRQIGWYSRGMRHANDAARQAYLLLSVVSPITVVRIWERGIIVAGNEIRFPDD